MEMIRESISDAVRAQCMAMGITDEQIIKEQADKAIEDAKAWEAEEEKREEAERKEIEKYVCSLSKQELREQLLWRMIDERTRRNRW